MALAIAKMRFMPGPAAATIAMSRRGCRSCAGLTGTGLAHARKNRPVRAGRSAEREWYRRGRYGPGDWSLVVPGDAPSSPRNGQQPIRARTRAERWPALTGGQDTK